jgi:hypothetical protein
MKGELAIRLNDAQIDAIKRRVQRRKREIAAAELKGRSEVGVVDLGVIDSESANSGT